jgi:ubiquinone/menaquinone biosynthesis C-methylase UbiE
MKRHIYKLNINNVVPKLFARMRLMENDQAGENTYVMDAESPTEMARLIHLDRFITQEMGGPLAGITDPQALHDVLDLGCGPGGWVLDVAFENPHMEVTGIDISRIMVDYANARARTQQRPNTSFGVMDITQPLDFSDASFDLINARFLVGVLRREVWPAFIAECTRLLRPGGILRLTDMIEPGMSTSPALEQLHAMLYQALWKAGYSFSPNGLTSGIVHTLPWLMRKAGYANMHHAAHVLEFSADTEAWTDVYHNVEIGFKLAQPFLVNVGVAAEEEIEHLLQQALIEMHAQDFRGIYHYMSFWGNKTDSSTES